MSLSATLQIGKSALAAQQAAIQVTGNNIANAGSADYTRQVASTSPAKDRQVAPGMFVGTGVQLDAVKRQIDEALENRLRGSVSESASADAASEWLGRIEAVFNELGDDDLSTRLSTFFNSWSNLANKPQDMGLRQVVLQEGQSVATWFNDMRRQLGSLQADADARTKALVTDADTLAGQIADLNGKIVQAEGGGNGEANGLRDQRDAALKKLSELVDVRAVADGGVTNVFIGSEPLVLNADSRGLAMKEVPVGGEMTTKVVIKSTGGDVTVGSGQLGGLVAARSKLSGVIEQVDAQARSLVFELNKLHASGQGLEGFSTATAAEAAARTDVPLNNSAAGLPFLPTNGSFVVHVRQKATGLVTSTLVQVNLDGTGPQTTLDSLRADLDSIGGVSASVTGGRLRVNADSDAVDVSFSQDSSGALSALGLNTFYTGRDARDISVNASVLSRPELLAAAKNGETADNQTARAIAALESQPVASLNGSSLKDSYQSMVNQVGVAASTAKTEAEAAATVRETLQSQREALSGVSLDEEAVNLMRQQRAFQGAARVVAVVDDLMKTILGMV